MLLGEKLLTSLESIERFHEWQVILYDFTLLSRSSPCCGIPVIFNCILVHTQFEISRTQRLKNKKDMDYPYSSGGGGGGGGGGSWVTIPNTQSHNTPPQTSSSNQDLSQFHQQQLHYQQQQQQQQRQQQQQQQQNHQSLASHFHLLNLVENLAELTENGTRDQTSDILVNELTTNFEKCQNLLNSIAGSISTKTVTVEGQKRKLEESEQLLNQRRELIAKYRGSVEELVKPREN